MGNAPVRGRVVQNTIVVVAIVLSLAALAIGQNLIRVAANAAFGITSARVILTLAGGLMLLSALAAILFRRWRAIQAKLFFSAIVFVFLIATAEVAARIAGFTPAPPHPSVTFWTVDDELGFTIQPNCQIRYLSALGWTHGTTDSAGYRPLIAARDIPDAPEIICLGDSTTFSSEVDDDQTWPEAANRALLALGKPCRVLNRGVYGYSGLQSMLHLRRILQQPGNYRAVVYYFCANDPFENFGHSLPAPALAPSGDTFTVTPPRRPLWGTISEFRLQPDFALLAAFREWRFSTGDAAYRSGAWASYPYSVSFYTRFMNDPKFGDGMRFVIAGMKEECDRHRLPLYVSSVTQPFWDRDGATRSEMASLMNITTIAEDARIYNEGCDKLRRIVTECGAEYVDPRGWLDGMSYRDYAASPLDWHFSGKANERTGKMIAEKLASRLDN